MKIKQLKLHPIAVADGPLRSSYGLHAPYALRTIVEVVTTDGILLRQGGAVYGGRGSGAAELMGLQREVEALPERIDAARRAVKAR